MKKTFVLVAAVLAAIQSALPEADAEGKYHLDEQALDALEGALAAADQAKADKDTEIKTLKDLGNCRTVNGARHLIHRE